MAKASDSTPSKAPETRTVPPFRVLAAGTVFGIIATGLFAAFAPNGWSVLAAAEMFAGASFATGGLLGLLFGVPRSLTAPAGEDGNPAGPVSGIGANTNLEKISDWLTTAIVGIAIAQIDPILDRAGRLFALMAPSLGGLTSSAAFAGAISVYFAVLGFLSGWLFARLRLGAAMSQADALLAFSARARKGGDNETADAAQLAAKNTVQRATASAAVPTTQRGDDLATLATQYNVLRATEPSGSRRTRAMNSLFMSARQQAKQGHLSAQDVQGMFELGTPGDRVMALALMEGDTALAHIPSIMDAIQNSRSAFEQYYALRLAKALSLTLTAEERTKLLDVLDSSTVIQNIGTDSSRATLRTDMKRSLSPPESPTGPQGD